MTVYIASDHAGFTLKKLIINDLNEKGYPVIDMGTSSATESVDYPNFAHAVVDALEMEPSAQGILICGTGIGMSIAANRFSHIRAALCHSDHDARAARQHNNANILCLGERTTDKDRALDFVHIFLTTPFDKGRHQQRLEKIKC